MIRINLQMFGGRGGSSGGGGPKEPWEDAVKRLTDGRGNVKEIEDGYRYTFYKYDPKTNTTSSESYMLKISASEAREELNDNGYKYDPKTGTFRDDRNRHYVVKLEKARNTGGKSKSSVKMMTALVRDRNGKYRVQRLDKYSTPNAFAKELSANGYHVINVWNGQKSDSDIAKWVTKRRKKG